MRRFRIPELFLGCFLTVAVFATGTLFNSQQEAIDEYSEKRELASTSGQKIRSESELTWSSWLTKDAAGFFTCLLVIVGIGQAGLFFVQLRYMRIGMRDATLAANAADLSAKAATAIEFPVVRTGWMGPEILATDELVKPNAPYGGSVNDGWPTKFSAIGDIKFTNFGRTPAFPEQISLAISVADKLPPTPVYTDQVRCDAKAVIEPKDAREIEIHFGFELTDEQIAWISRSEKVLWFYGVLTFRDIMDRSHGICFCWQWGRQNEADSVSYFFDDGSAPAAYTAKT
jgi:hypothetical protein